MDVITHCAFAFLVVFVLLSLLAASMKLITALFPTREEAFDSAVVVAITSTVASVYSGARVTKIEEER